MDALRPRCHAPCVLAQSLSVHYSRLALGLLAPHRSSELQISDFSSTTSHHAHNYHTHLLLIFILVLSQSILSPMFRSSLRPRRLICAPSLSRVGTFVKCPGSAAAPISSARIKQNIALSRPFSQQPWSPNNLDDSSGFPIIGDTIYALSTAQGRAGIAVIRISGPSCLEVCVSCYQLGRVN